MNDVIKLLPDSVANLIAAGEVITRPASVIKELVENAVDAGATTIDIIIADGGRTLVQVIDNGCGMTDTDARMAFERHATSKITVAQDLLTLHTMGFRGEALPSIAAVAQVDIRTMPHDATVGTHLEINGSKVETVEACVCTAGTNIMVRNLFYTFPARRKYLKKDSVEFAHIVREFERLALVNPSLNFSLSHDGRMIHQLRASSMKQRICELFGKNLDRQLIPVGTDTSMVRIDGFIGLPANARKRNQLQYLLINGRNMRHPLFHKAILECYEELIPHDEQPNYFVSFSVDPESIDVNIHPTKNEVKFENEFGIRQILVAAVKESLGKHNAMPGIDFDTDDAPVIPAFNPNAEAGHGVEVDPTYNPFTFTADEEPVSPADASGFVEIRSGLSGKGARTQRASGSGGFVDIPSRRVGSEQTIAGTDWEALYDEFTRRRDAAPAPPASDTLPNLSPADSEPETTRSGVLQVLDRYLAVSCRSGMMLIDQHRAHVRVLYERYLALARESAVPSQALLFPRMLTLSGAQNALLESVSDEMARLGFEITPLGDNVWNITAVPATAGNAPGAETVQQLLEQLELVGEITYGEANPLSRAALSMAKSMAVKSGMRLTADEARSIADELLSLPAPNYTPDGRLIIAMLGRDDLARLFSR